MGIDIIDINKGVAVVCGCIDEKGIVTITMFKKLFSKLFNIMFT